MSQYELIKSYNKVIDGITDRMGLIRIPGPLLVNREDNINDMLSSDGRGPLSFSSNGDTLEVVQSLAKWKRLALHVYDIIPGDGIYVDMHAIRQDEEIGPIHSRHVEQIDWEVRIHECNRNMEYLSIVIRDLYQAIRDTEIDVTDDPILPEDIHFITYADLDAKYPHLVEKERENSITQVYKAVCITCIPGPSRSWEYDDWLLNADILLWSDKLNRAVEISSMGIRVDSYSMKNQALKSGADIPSSVYHDGVMNDTLPYTIGGGIGKYRLAMILLKLGDIHQFV